MATYRALLSLKSSLDDPDSRLSSWTPNTSHCTWAGVTCDSHNHVTSLDLSGLNLSGYLSPDIAFHVYLSNLTLAENNLSGPIPPEISALSTLRLLNFSNNVFNHTFPPELSNLTNLRVLNLYNNNLTGVLPVSVAHMTNLRHLHLGGRKFSRKFLQFFFQNPATLADDIQTLYSLAIVFLIFFNKV
ncbi:hypothetical protein ACLB2K_028992 [Fragaria x ananassa]